MGSRTSVHPAAWWMLLAGAVVVLRLLSHGILEPTDGIWHYQIARWAWVHPHLLLDHWGKPLYTLLASPFAQLGHWGMTLFNALCFVATCWAADGLLRRAGTLARWLYAPALLLAPVYGSMVLAGMTEVFFGLLTVLVLRALMEQRYVLASLIASFMPFARPEYVVFVPVVLLWLARHRQWRALPWLLTGHMVYGLLGAIFLRDALWYFNQDPYIGAADIYGSGDLWHFWARRSNILGVPLMWLIALSLPMAAILWWRAVTERPMLRLLLLVGLLPALGIAALHSFLWWKGLKGSLGLERVLATTIPLLALFAVWMLARWFAFILGPGWRQGFVTVLGTGLLVFFSTKEFHSKQPVPVRPDADIEFLGHVSAQLAAMPPPQGAYMIFQPYITYALGLNPFDPVQSVSSWLGDNFGHGDRLVWDAHFGPNEANLPLERLLADSTMRVLCIYVPKEHMVRLGGHAMQVLVFERGLVHRWQEADTLYREGWELEVPIRMDHVPCGTDGPCLSEAEYPFAVEDLPVGAHGMCFTELIIRGAAHWPEGEGEAHLVFAEDGPVGHQGYRSIRLSEGTFSERYRLPPRPPGSSNKLYVWNLSGKPFALRGLEVVSVRTFQEYR